MRSVASTMRPVDARLAALIHPTNAQTTLSGIDVLHGTSYA